MGREEKGKEKEMEREEEREMKERRKEREENRDRGEERGEEEEDSSGLASAIGNNSLRTSKYASHVESLPSMGKSLGPIPRTLWLAAAICEDHTAQSSYILCFKKCALGAGHS